MSIVGEAQALADDLGRRSGDRTGLASVTCWVAHRLSEFWEFVDKRDIDKHVVSVAVLYGTWRITEWAMAFAERAAALGRPGLEVAAVIAAVTAPYMALQAAALAFYFRARS